MLGIQCIYICVVFFFFGGLQLHDGLDLCDLSWRRVVPLAFVMLFFLQHLNYHHFMRDDNFFVFFFYM